MPQKRRLSLDAGAGPSRAGINRRGQQPSAVIEAPHACGDCPSRFQTINALKKHRLKHSRQFMCEEQGCTRTEGFGSRNDVDRHRKTIHHVYIPELKDYKCQGRSCNHPEKIWTRPDNFRTHVRTIHKDEDLEDVVQRSELPDAIAPDQSTGYQPATPSTGTRPQSPTTHYETDQAPDHQQYPQLSAGAYAPAYAMNPQLDNVFGQGRPTSMPNMPNLADTMAQPQGNPISSQPTHYHSPQLGSPFSPSSRLPISLGPLSGQNVPVPHITLSPPGVHAMVGQGGNASWNLSQVYPGIRPISTRAKDKQRVDDPQEASPMPNSVLQMHAALAHLNHYNQSSRHVQTTQINSDELPSWSNAVSALQNAMLIQPVPLANYSIDHLAQAAIMVADGQFSQGSVHSHLASPELTPSHVRSTRATALLTELRNYDRTQAERQWHDVHDKVILQLASNHEQSEELMALSATTSNEQSSITPASDQNQYTGNDQFSGGNDNASSSGMFGSIPGWSPRQDTSPFSMPYGGVPNMGPSQSSPSSPTPSMQWRTTEMAERTDMSVDVAPLPVAVPATAHSINTLKQPISNEQSPRDSAYSSFTCMFWDFGSTGRCYNCNRTLEQHDSDPASEWLSYRGTPSPPS